jgi:hypothetical protein
MKRPSSGPTRIRLRRYVNTCLKEALSETTVLGTDTNHKRSRSQSTTMADKITRIAIVDSNKCKPKRCAQECKKVSLNLMADLTASS